jgi:hypothetical protein
MIQHHSSLSFLGPLSWIFLWIAASIVFRRSRGKPIFPTKPQDSIFYERTASGHSHRNFLTAIGGARNCLMVAVTPQELIVQPWFPLNLMFLPEIYDLEHRIPRANIRGIKESRFVFGKTIRIDYLDLAGGMHAISLILRKPDDFLQSIHGPA